MSLEKPIIEQLNESTQNVGENFQGIKDSVQNTLADFSDKGVVGNTSEFLETNGLFAKIAFILLVLILFLFFLRLGIQALGYFLSPSKSPFIVYGKIDGGTNVTISQSPTNTSAIPIFRSNNEHTGAEFTWSVWLYLNVTPDPATAAGVTYVPNNRTIFVKGPSSPNLPTATNRGDNTHITNGPGMYVYCDQSGVGHLNLILDDITTASSTRSDGVQTQNQNRIVVDNIPLQKWVHVAYRLKNTILDVYVNGSINNRLQIAAAPKQNYYDINIGANGGFPGYLSNLRYYDHALNVFDINNIVMFGPNLTNSSLSSDFNSANGNYSYLSTRWYNLH